MSSPDPLVLNPKGRLRTISLGEAMAQALLRAPANKQGGHQDPIIRLMHRKYNRVRYARSRGRAIDPNIAPEHRMSFSEYIREHITEIRLVQTTVTREELVEALKGYYGEEFPARRIRQAVTQYMNHHHTEIRGTPVRTWTLIEEQPFRTIAEA